MVDPNIYAVSKYAYLRVGGDVLFISNDGASVFSNGNVSKLVDRYRYDCFSHTPTSIFHNQLNNEYWFIFDNSYVLVWDYLNKGFRRMSYSGDYVNGEATNRFGFYAFDTSYIVIGKTLAVTDDDSVTDDFNGSSLSQYISCYAQTRYLSDMLTQLKIIESTVYGQNGTVQLNIAQGSARREGTTSAWTSSVYYDYYGNTPTLKMYGATDRPNARCIKPILQYVFSKTGDLLVEEIVLRVTETENQGLAR